MSIQSKIKEIKDMFMIFDDSMDKYTQIIELGKKSSGIPNSDKHKDNQIFGCASMAWVICTKNDNKYNIATDSDTLIVKGLLNIIQYILNNETKEEIMKLNIEDILNNVGLGNSITSQRTNGLINALNKIKKEIN